MAEKCIAPGEMQEGDLVAFLEGVADTSVADHMRRCPACAAEAAALLSVEATLGATAFRLNCPDADELLQYQAGLLPKNTHQRIRLHVQDCSFCQSELAGLDLPAAPATSTFGDLVRRLANMIWRASLVPTLTPSAALRGEEERSFVYQAGPYQILLRQIPMPIAGGGWRLEGLITSSDDDEWNGVIDGDGGGEAQLRKDALIVAQDQVDISGYFAFDQQPAGEYALHILFPGNEVIIAGVVIA